MTHRTDVSNVEQVNSWIESTIKRFGRLDGAANIAGIALGDGQATENTVSKCLLCKIPCLMLCRYKVNGTK